MKENKGKKGLFKSITGFSLVEVMIAISILAIGVLGIMSVYLYVSKGLIVTARKTVVNNLGKEKLETMKSIDYDKLIPTPSAALADPNHATNPYPPEDFTISKVDYTRQTIVRKVYDNNGTFTNLDYDDPSHGMKRIEVYLLWSTPNESGTVYYQALRDDPEREPLNGTIEGTVYKLPALDELSGAKVEVVENPTWNDTSDADGDYSIIVSTGTYYFRASKDGYYTQTKQATVPIDAPVSVDFHLMEIDVGSIWGIVRDTAATVMRGAVVTCDDGISDSDITDAAGRYDLTGVATGYWTVYVSSNSLQLCGDATNVLVIKGGTTVQDIVLDSSTVNGSISGMVKDAFGNNLSNITISAGGKEGTSFLGNYTIYDIEPSTYTVVANPNCVNSNYTAAYSTGVVVNTGFNTVAGTFYLDEGGSISGYVSIGGTDDLPDTTVRAVDANGTEQGATATETDGTFLISGLPAGGSYNDYTVELVLPTDFLSSPEDRTVEVLQGITQDQDTSAADIDFDVTPSKVDITGTVMDGTDLITIGCLVIASTDTITNPPPDVDLNFRNGTTIYYGTTSISDGTYTLPVSASGSEDSLTYNIAVWYTEMVDDTPSTTRQLTTATVYKTSGTVVNFSW